MDDELLSIGQRCVVSGLASRAELNGRGGSIVGYDAQSGRHIVKVDGQEGSSSFSLRAANVGAAAAESSLEPSRMAPVTVRRAWRSYLGEFDGDTEDEDEYIADVRVRVRRAHRRTSGEEGPSGAVVQRAPAEGPKTGSGAGAGGGRAKISGPCGNNRAGGLETSGGPKSAISAEDGWGGPSVTARGPSGECACLKAAFRA